MKKSFRQMVDRRLSGVDQEEKLLAGLSAAAHPRRRPIRRSLLAAGVMALVLAAAACAAVVRLGVMDMPFIQPLDRAKEGILSDGLAVSNHLLSARITEMAYDGVALYATVEYQAAQPESHLLLRGSDAQSEEGQALRQAAKASQREPLLFDDLLYFEPDGQMNWLFNDGEGRPWGFAAADQVFSSHYYDGETLIVQYMDMLIVEEGAEEIVLALAIDFPGAPQEQLELRHAIARAGQPRAQRYLVLSQPEPVRILQAQLIKTDFAAYLNVAFTWPQGLSVTGDWRIKIYDAQGGEIAAPYSKRHVLENSQGDRGMRYRAVLPAGFEGENELALQLLCGERSDGGRIRLAPEGP